LRKLKENNFNELKTFESILNKNNSDINSDWLFYAKMINKFKNRWNNKNKKYNFKE
jgi:hypothetical protein